MSACGWIGADLDGTLAEYKGWKGPEHIGAPIQKMVDRVKTWIEEGQEVKIFTARVSHDGTVERITEAEKARKAIQAWCLTHLGKILDITNLKDYAMTQLWDDRAVQLIPNTGERADGND